MENEIQLSSDRFPLVLVRYPRTIHQPDFERFIVDLNAVYDRGKLAVVADLSESVASSQRRSAIARRIDEVTLSHPNTVVAEAIVTPSSLQRGMATAYNWIKKDKSYLTKCFDTMGPAIAWAVQQLAEHGLDVPEAGTKKLGDEE